MGWSYSATINGVTYNQGDVVYVDGNGYISAYAGSSVGINYGTNYQTKFYGYYTASGTISYPVCLGQDDNGNVVANYFVAENQIKPQTSVLTVNPNGGTWNGSTNTQSFTQKLGTTKTMTPPTRTGYTFNAWYAELSPTTTNWGKNVNTGNSVIPRYYFDKVSGSNIEVMVYAPNASGVRIPTWTSPGSQDDITWIWMSGGSWSRDGKTYNFGVQLSIADHNYELNDYITHIYAYDSSNNVLDNIVAISGVDLPVKGGHDYYFGPNNYTLYANWTVNSYTVSFNANGGSVSTTSKSVTYNSTYGSLPTPARSGYRFKGWYTAKSGGSQVTSSTKVTITSNQTLYAQWVAIYYLDLNVFLNGSVINDTSVFHCDVKVGGSTVATNVCDYYAQHDTGTTWSISDLVTASGYTRYSTGTTSGTLTTKTDCNIYIGRNYTITYNANGGSGSTTQTVNYGTSWTTKGAICSKTGYTQTSWNTKADGTGDPYSLNKAQTATQSSNLTLYAIYTPNNYTLTLDANGGSVATTSCPVTYDSSNYCELSWNIPTLTGHTFNGWYTAKNGGTQVYGSDGYCTNEGAYWSNNYWHHAGNVTLYAQWTPNNYTYNIVYKSSSGAQLGTNSVTQTYGTTRTIDPASFEGYTSPASQSVSWDSTSAKTITFVYEPIVYKITYDLDDGIATNPTSYTIETETFTLNNPTRTNFEFLGWEGSNGAPSLSVTIPKGSMGDKTYSAIWELSCYYIVFNYGNRVQEIKTYEVLIGESFTIPDIIPFNDGYVFKGWCMSENSNTLDYVVGDTFTPNSNVTLYAIWELNPNYILSLDIISCWRTSETTAKLVVLSKFCDLSYIASLNKYPTILSSTINASIDSITLLSSTDATEEYVVDEIGNNLSDEDGTVLISANETLKYKYELILNIDNTLETGVVVLELTDEISTIRKSVRITGTDSNADNIYIYKQSVSNTIFGDNGNPIYDEDGNEIIAEMKTGGDICEAVEFIESDDVIGFQKGGRVYAKEFIEKDGAVIANGMQFTRFIEKVSTINVITMTDGSVLTDIDGAIIRTL